jgi:DNA polymerase-3 subunit gamma/tau
LKEGSVPGNGAGAKTEPSPPPEPAPALAREANADTNVDTSVDLSLLESENPAPSDALPDPQSFDDLVALVDEKRDLKLKNALLEQVRLVRFKPGHLELKPLPTAAPDLLQELMRKLKAWTGRVWIISPSDQEGAEPLGVRRRAEAKREIEQLQAHPAVQEVLTHFPGARITAVRAMADTAPGTDSDTDGDEAGDPEEFKDDGTN